jgi:alanine racemase
MPVRALASVNLAAIERNVTRLRAELDDSCLFCAVVKADAYGHGAVPVAHAALAAGSRWLAVATAEEAAQLRRGGIIARILVLGALSAEELAVALAARADVVAWSERFVESVVRVGGTLGRERPVPVHVKLDTGMGRLGTRDRAEALATAEAVLAAEPAVELAGAMTHFATADEDDAEFMEIQLGRFVPFVKALREREPGLIVHAANSAATIGTHASHFDLVRCGIAIYGGDPASGDPDAARLEPALELDSYVAALKPVEPGESAGYGRKFVAERSSWLATAPIGYADGVRRALSNNCDVLIGGRRYPLVGNVSMDNITADVGPEPDPSVTVGARVRLIGREGAERQTAEDLARRIGTINYEILCGITARVPRSYHRDGVAA